MPWTARVQNSPDPWEWFQTKVGPEPFGSELKVQSWKLGDPSWQSNLSLQSAVGSRKFQVVRRKGLGARGEELGFEA